tara:strand:+ start:288 stop:488 length:201 start_codon:yes stop_codon:yes gene_type:complete
MQRTSLNVFVTPGLMMPSSGSQVIDAVMETMGLSVQVLLVSSRVSGWDSARIEPENRKTVSGGAKA